MLKESLLECPLGKETPYLTHYDPSLLFGIPRAETREQIKILGPLPFKGADIWYAYELSWLNPKGKPIVAIAEMTFPCSSPNLMESKALKRYLHSFNQTKFKTILEVQNIMEQDLSASCKSTVKVNIIQPSQFKEYFALKDFDGTCLDELDVATDIYTIDPTLLKVNSSNVNENLYSNLLKSNCLVTNQPDWGHVYISYKGKQIDHGSLLKYIISYRNHDGFHEQCIERIFVDILNRCHPEQLTVYGRYTRRGGLDINPFRSNFEDEPSFNFRLFRQ
jgi:7-cyano-7-deazaguanine reductase